MKPFMSPPAAWARWVAASCGTSGPARFPSRKGRTHGPGGATGGSACTCREGCRRRPGRSRSSCRRSGSPASGRRSAGSAWPPAAPPPPAPCRRGRPRSRARAASRAGRLTAAPRRPRSPACERVCPSGVRTRERLGVDGAGVVALGVAEQAVREAGCPRGRERVPDHVLDLAVAERLVRVGDRLVRRVAVERVRAHRQPVRLALPVELDEVGHRRADRHEGRRPRGTWPSIHSPASRPAGTPPAPARPSVGRRWRASRADASARAGSRSTAERRRPAASASGRAGARRQHGHRRAIGSRYWNPLTGHSSKNRTGTAIQRQEQPLAPRSGSRAAPRGRSPPRQAPADRSPRARSRRRRASRGWDAGTAAR